MKKGASLNRQLEQLFALETKISREEEGFKNLQKEVKRTEHRLWSLNRRLSKKRADFQKLFFNCENCCELLLKFAKKSVLVVLKNSKGFEFRKRLSFNEQDQFLIVWSQSYVQDISEDFWFELLAKMDLDNLQQKALRKINRIKVTIVLRRHEKIKYWQRQKNRFVFMY